MHFEDIFNKRKTMGGYLHTFSSSDASKRKPSLITSREMLKPGLDLAREESSHFKPEMNILRRDFPLPKNLVRVELEIQNGYPVEVDRPRPFLLNEPTISVGLLLA